MKKLTFARTPIMSSYLLAFIVGEFDYVEATDSNGVLVRVYTPLGKAEQGRFALDVSLKLGNLLLSGCWNRGVPLYTVLISEGGIEEFHCIQRCSHFRGLE